MPRFTQRLIYARPLLLSSPLHPCTPSEGQPAGSGYTWVSSPTPNARLQMLAGNGSQLGS